ncbi:MAG: hypothetical protein JNK65_01160 [Deltaproteobacteria bacterium]|nr:hypothetical protein [Deltaproteobacteria bacterium]
MSKLWAKLPGEELIQKGLEDLRSGFFSTESLLILIAAPRLKSLGIVIPNLEDPPLVPEHALYELLQTQHPKDAYSRYNSLIRRLVSYERSMERHIHSSSYSISNFNEYDSTCY